MAQLGVFLYHEEMTIKLIVFLSVSLICLFSEWRWPRRHYRYRMRRWPVNWGMVVTSQIPLFVLGGLGAPAMAEYFAIKGIGLGHYFSLNQELWYQLSCLIFLDLMIYWQHRLSHLVPLFWRFHRIHHGDGQLDSSTALRFHPIEIYASLLFKGALIAIFGIHPGVVLIFEMLLSGSAIFNHANWKLPGRLDHYLQTFLVTPDMHRVHHSQIRQEHDQNFGFCLSFWDRLFGSWGHWQEDEQRQKPLGLKNFDTGGGLIELLILPLKKFWSSSRF